jgi:ribosome-binding protein aMBF1 (putative translation factor)
MADCIHLVTAERFPLTRCGVDTNVKEKALWSDEEEMVTCRNCLKLREGKQMGARPPANGGTREKQAKADLDPDREKRIAHWVLIDKLGRLQGRIEAIVMDARTVMGEVILTGRNVWQEEVEDPAHLVEHIEAAEARLKMVVDQVRERMKSEEGGD